MMTRHLYIQLCTQIYVYIILLFSKNLEHKQILIYKYFCLKEKISQSKSVIKLIPIMFRLSWT